MSLYVVLVDSDLKRLPGADPALPKVVAHNLSREDAEHLEAQLTADSIEAQPTGWAPFLLKYAEPHAQTEPSNCLECEEVVLEHCKHLLDLLQQEMARRPPE